MEQVARKSPHACHVQPHTACVCSVKVCTHSARAKSQILAVVSPDTVASFEPLRMRNEQISAAISIIVKNNEAKSKQKQ